MKGNKYLELFKWPMAKDMPSSAVGMYKSDKFLVEVNKLVEQKKAACPISGGTRRTELKSRVESWIEEQMDHYNSVSKKPSLKKDVSLDVSQFPKSETGTDTLTITTSKTQLFLIDSSYDLISCYESVYGKKEILRRLLGDNPLLLFEVDSLESGGRAFSGDPFTGQMAAFSKVYCTDLENNKERKFIIYYPHQLHTQFFSSGGILKDNKGTKVIAGNVDLVITNNGVLINPKDWSVL